jgi:hypothetical protein
VLIELEVDVVVESVDVLGVEAVDVAAMTQGDTSMAATMAIPAIAVSCNVRVFILSSVVRGCSLYILDFPDDSQISTDSVQESHMISARAPIMRPESLSVHCLPCVHVWAGFS